MAHKRQVGISTYIIAVLVPALFMLVALNTLLQKSNSQVGTLEHELVGLHTLKDLSQLQFFLQELRALGQFKHLHEGSPADIEVRHGYVYTQVLLLIDDLSADHHSGQLPRLDFLNRVKQRVISLEQKSHLSGAQHFAEYTLEIERLLSFIREVASYSHLTRDPELNAYYRVTKVVESIPMLLEYVAQLQSMPIRALSDNSDLVEMRLMLGYQLAHLNAEMQQLLASNHYLKNDDIPDEKGDTLLNELSAQVQAYMKTVSQLDIYNLRVSQVLAGFYEAERLINQLSQLQQHNLDVLEVSIQQRVVGQIKQRNRSVMMIVLAILAMLLGIGWFYRINNRAFVQLAKSEYLMKRVLDTIPVRVFWKDLDGYYLGCNVLFSQDLGTTPSEVIGKSDREIAWRDDVDACRADDRAVIQSGVANIGLQEQVQNSKGETRWIESSKIPLLSSQGVVVGLLCVFQDITKRKQSELNLFDSEKRLRTVVDTMADALIVFEDKGRIHSFNYAAEKIFGYFSEQVITHNIATLIPDFQSDHWRQGSDQTTDHVVGAHFKVNALRCNGENFPAEVSVSAMETGGERLYTIVVRDITEQNRHERLKDAFVSTVSHELRTPLTSIRGSLGLVLGGVTGELPEKALKMLQLASNNTERLLLLINDILDIQKIEAGEVPVNMASHGVDELLATTLENNQVYAAQYGVTFQLKVIDLGLKVSADARRLNQVISNLLSNAAKFSPKGAVVELSVQRHGDEHVRISVADQGCGIALDFQGKLFDKFTQYDSSDVREKGGTGLGMTITKALVEKMGGEISYDTVEGEGTTFYVDLKQG
ncbi:MAG: PAS domain S-box protein [Gammaproteobacteria bacterium]|nr:PAS domain S-box protein [Gammaproteobacteria bacterium]MCF6231074.1 PAS domain S-box protein [Gammaproteobacteria bacterium]